MAKLIPPDSKRCQVVITPAHGFMVHGPRDKPARCTNPAITIAEELQPGSDGQKGAMSLCASCLTVFVKRPEAALVRFTELNEQSKVGMRAIPDAAVIDTNTCQLETDGPHTFRSGYLEPNPILCRNPAVFVVFGKAMDSDGRKQSVAICADCLEIFHELPEADRIRFVELVKYIPCDPPLVQPKTTIALVVSGDHVHAWKPTKVFQRYICACEATGYRSAKYGAHKGAIVPHKVPQNYDKSPVHIGELNDAGHARRGRHQPGSH